MPAEWFIAVNGQQAGPYETAALPAAGLQPDSLVWRAGFPEWLPANNVPELAHLFAPPPTNNYQPTTSNYAPVPVPTYRPTTGDRVAAGLCGIFFGWAGVHKFILGLNQAGWIMLAVSSFTCGLGGMVMATIGLIEGIIYLSKTDQQFYEQYTLGKRQWF